MDEAEQAVKKFMDTGTPETDPYWSLFRVKEEVNDAIVKAVEYGYKKGYEAGVKAEKERKV